MTKKLSNSRVPEGGRPLKQYNSSHGFFFDGIRIELKHIVISILAIYMTSFVCGPRRRVKSSRYLDDPTNDIRVHFECQGYIERSQDENMNWNYASLWCGPSF